MHCTEAGSRNHAIFDYENLTTFTRLPLTDEEKEKLIIKSIKKIPCYLKHLNEKDEKKLTLLEQAYDKKNFILADALLALGAEGNAAKIAAKIKGLSSEVRFKKENVVSSGFSKYVAPSNKDMDAMVASFGEIEDDEFDELLGITEVSLGSDAIGTFKRTPVVSNYPGISDEAFLGKFLECVREDDLEKLKKMNKIYRLALFKDIYNGQSLLHISVANGASGEFTNKLLNSYGISVTKKDSEGRTALHTAAIHHNYEAFKLLYGYGEVLDSKRRTSFHYAAIHGCLPILRVGLSAIPNNHRDIDGYNFLHLAAIHDQAVAVDCIVSFFVERDNISFLNLGDNRDNLSALELAAKHGHKIVVNLLRVFAEDEVVSNAMKLAREAHRDDIADDIIASKAKAQRIADEIISKALSNLKH